MMSFILALIVGKNADVIRVVLKVLLIARR